MTADDWREAIDSGRVDADLARAAAANRADCEQRARANRERYWITFGQGLSVLAFIAFVIFLCGVI